MSAFISSEKQQQQKKKKKKKGGLRMSSIAILHGTLRVKIGMCTG